MNNEIKLYIITKHLYALLGDKVSVMDALENILQPPEGYIDNWMSRYNQLSTSRETQVMMLKKAGYTYRSIQDIAKVSPTSIRRILDRFSLSFAPLEGSENMTDSLKQLEKRCKTEGIKVW